MATPGLIPGITILFKSLGLPMSYIGLFSAYSVFIKNSAIAFCGFYRTLEELEAAYIMNHVDKTRLQEAH